MPNDHAAATLNGEDSPDEFTNWGEQPSGDCSFGGVALMWDVTTKHEINSSSTGSSLRLPRVEAGDRKECGRTEHQRGGGIVKPEPNRCSPGLPTSTTLLDGLNDRNNVPCRLGRVVSRERLADSHMLAGNVEVERPIRQKAAPPERLDPLPSATPRRSTKKGLASAEGGT